MDRSLSKEEKQDLLAWVDKVPFSRPKRNITRDFSDGVMIAEIIKHFFPKIVDLHNYSASCKTQQKLSNWRFLNKRVFPKLDMDVPEEMVKKIVTSTPGAIVPVLSVLKEKIEEKLQYYETRSQEKPFSDVEIQQAEARIVAQLAELKITETKVKPQHMMFYTEMNPATIRQILLEKELQVQDLQETVKVFQVKVTKLEELVRLKDKRIEYLTCLPEAYKTKLQLAG
ncbi:sperm flagellar protein 1 isoform X2 [Girardinichthys multiradiatus]|uniref:sperm flagellar protein 1 isoform X2 n=1 Tax=Girardinichthys multiradiatus TaxID=208333 RepID=UPI001FABE3BB|nr:sperm flagellar protein 1 isoform X2 [Girardinichthys multiradiatus]